MEHPLGYLFAVLTGISLELIGGGGSIITVPVPVYLLHADLVLANTYSLSIVGITSLAGATRAYINKFVDFKAISLFGIPSILTIFIARHSIFASYTRTNFYHWRFIDYEWKTADDDICIAHAGCRHFNDEQPDG